MSIADLNISNEEDIFTAFDQFSTGFRDRALRKCITAAAAPIEALAKSKCRKDLGSLANSITTVVKSGNARGDRIEAIIGPKRRVKIPIGVKSRGRSKGKVLYAIPTNYAWNLEYGHKVVSPGFGRIRKNGRVVKEAISSGVVAPRPFMRPAWDAEGGEKALDRFEEKAETLLDQEISKISKRVKP